MHELAITRSIVDLVEAAARREGVARVERVRLVIGALASVEAEALRFCFDVVARGTLSERAALEIASEPASGWCEQCARAVEVTQLPAACPGCGAVGLAFRGGDGVRVAELEVV